jgi:hypothetical protein
VGLNRRPFRQLREVSKEELPSEAQVAMPPTDWGTLRTKKQVRSARSRQGSYTKLALFAQLQAQMQD